MELAVYNIEGNKTEKTVELKDDIFGIKPNEHAIYLDVKHFLANQRQGTHKAKGRSEVKGSTRKLRRQKGTGMARVGDIKSPIFRGGGVIFGPKPRDYGFKLNKKVKRLARKSALSQKAKDNNMMIVEDFTMEAPKTKQFLDILKKLELDNKKSLLVLGESNQKIFLSARNIPNSKVKLASQLNTYEILNCQQVVIAESAIKEIESNLLK